MGAFINALSEEGTKAEILGYLIKEMDRTEALEHALGEIMNLNPSQEVRLIAIKALQGGSK